jgi:methylenetetrahydrofolate reductase (NADPH)
MRPAPVRSGANPRERRLARANPTRNTLACMRIDEILASSRPVFSVEFFPPKTEEGRETLFETVDVLRKLGPSFFSVTYGAGGATREGTVEITREIRDEHGVEAMAHLSCVGESREALREILAEIADAGIENILALRGDPPRGETDFEQPEGGLGSAAELTTLIGEAHPSLAIGGACFPEVHPEAPTLDADIAYLKTKVDNGASFLITQLFYDNRSYFDFVPAARAAGIDVPIIPGIMPMTRYKQIARIAELCEARIPDRLSEAMEAADGNEQAEFGIGVAYAAQQCAELLREGAPGIHFYALNRWPATRAILAALQAARPWEDPSSGEPAAVRAT